MRYLADVHVSPLTVRMLQVKGYDVTRVTEFLSPSSSDREILELARQLPAVLITADLDFTALVATSGAAGPSVVSLRLAFPTPDRVAMALEGALPRLQTDLERGAIVSIDESSVRVRRLPIR